jgi:SpoVK/Ycf46/Vps4 family AAA+-type ATPase
MAAEALAHELGIDLYVIDMATVVDKYIGETEKNLERIFSEGEGVNAVLLFDEADALFGKRTNIGDAHDRYANLEISFLLHRMESFNGLAFLSTNLRANLDDALVRRLDISIDFPMPDEHERQLLWQRCLGGDVPRASDLDLMACARTFELSGSSIRSVAIGAAYRAAAGARCVTMDDLLVSARQEYDKLGRMMPSLEASPGAT